MADDKRTYDLTAITASELQTLLSTLSLDIDDPSFSTGESKKLLLSLLLNSSVISSNANNYQAITQKAFYDSVATTSRNGVTKLATSGQVDAGSDGNLAVIASELKRKLDETLAAALSSSNIKLRLAAYVSAGGTVSKLKGDLSVTVAKLSAGEYKITHNLGTTLYMVNFNCSRIDSARNLSKISGVYKGSDYIKVDTGDDGSANDSAFNFEMFSYIE